MRGSQSRIKKLQPIRSMKSVKISRQPTLPSNDSIFSTEFSSDKVFQPNLRSFVQLSTTPPLVNFNSKQVQKDKLSFSKLLNIDRIIKKSTEIHSDLKALIAASNNKLTTNGEEIIKTRGKHEKLKMHPLRITFFNEVKSGNLEKIGMLVKKHPELVSEVDSTEQTALHWACRRGFTDIVKFLLEAGAKAGAEDFVGRRPEDIARSKGGLEILTLLAVSKRRSAVSVLIEYLRTFYSSRSHAGAHHHDVKMS